MVALVILGIAAVGIVRASEAHIDAIFGLERRAAAQWVAENALAEASLDPTLAGSGVRDMLGWQWDVRVNLQSSDDPDLQLAIVEVRESGAAESIVTLQGFVDRGTITP